MPIVYVENYSHYNPAHNLNEWMDKWTNDIEEKRGLSAKALEN